MTLFLIILSLIISLIILISACNIFSAKDKAITIQSFCCVMFYLIPLNFIIITANKINNFNIIKVIIIAILMILSAKILLSSLNDNKHNSNS